MIPLPVTNPTNHERIPLQLNQLPPRDIGPLSELQHILIEIPPKVRWIVAIHGNTDTLPQQREDLLTLEGGCYDTIRYRAGG